MNLQRIVLSIQILFLKLGIRIQAYNINREMEKTETNQRPETDQKLTGASNQDVSKVRENTDDGEENKQKLNEKVLELTEKWGQGHLLEHYYILPNDEKRRSFLQQLEGIDFEKTASLYKNVYQASKAPKQEVQPDYQPIKHVANREVLNQYEEEFNQIGMERISKGEVGVCIMSGGQGTRLGFDHPKGMYDIGLDSHYTLFEFFARRLLRLMQVTKKQFPDSGLNAKNMIKWYIMTSEMNNQEVSNFFKQHNYFGYDPESVVFFPQGGIPALDYEGKIVIESEGQISLAPGGNGAIYEEMLNKGVINHMKDSGVKYIYLGPVDNILLKLADPTCLGYMVKNNFDIVSTYVDKISADQKVGLHLLCNGKVKICEYSEVTKQVKQKKDGNGQFVFKHGSRATMFISRDFIEAITTNKEVVERINKSYHLAEKKIKYFDKTQNKSIKPEKNNGVKFELFYFDVFEETNKFGLFETIRTDEFAPVKNADGDDSPASAKELLRNLHLKWIKKAGIEVEGQGYVEIDPRLSYNGQGLKELVKDRFGAEKIKLPVFIK